MQERHPYLVFLHSLFLVCCGATTFENQPLNSDQPSRDGKVTNAEEIGDGRTPSDASREEEENPDLGDQVKKDIEATAINELCAIENTRSGVEIQLLKSANLCFESEENHVVFIGNLNLDIQNNTCERIAIAHMETANFLFVRKLDGYRFTLFQSCAPGFLYYHWDRESAARQNGGFATHEEDWEMPEGGEVVFLQPGQRKSFFVEILEGEGVQWKKGRPYEGMYEIMYRAHEIEPHPTFVNQETIDNSDEKAKLKIVRKRAMDARFWEGAIESNTIEIEIKQCEGK